MSIPDPTIGLVINYSYLWADEAQRGNAEGLKDRPCIIIGMKDTGTDKTVLVVPITHSPPTREGSVEISARVKAHLGLDEERSWVVTSEVNTFTWSTSADVRPIGRGRPEKFTFGLSTGALTRMVRDQVRTYTLQRTLAVTRRDEGNPEPADLRRRQAPKAERQQDWYGTHEEPDIDDDLYPDLD